MTLASNHALKCLLCTIPLVLPLSFSRAEDLENDFARTNNVPTTQSNSHLKAIRARLEAIQRLPDPTNLPDKRAAKIQDAFEFQIEKIRDNQGEILRIGELNGFLQKVLEVIILTARPGKPHLDFRFAVDEVRDGALQQEEDQENRNNERTKGGAAIPVDPFFVRGSAARKVGADQWAWKQIGLDEATLKKLFSKQVKPITVAVIDSGVDVWHRELRGKLWVNPKEKPGNGKDDDQNGLIDDIHGYNFAEMLPTAWDRHGHGTYVAGIIAARWDTQGIAGVNPNVRIMVINIADFKGVTRALPIVRGIRYAVNHGAKILHLPHATIGRNKPLEDAVRWAIKQGTLVVAAVNSHSKDASEQAPGNVPGALTVGACDKEGKRAPFSGWGANLDVVAPGVDIIGLRALGTDFLATMAGRDPKKSPSGNAIDKYWYVADGSCSAAPFVTALAAHLWQQKPALNAQQIRRMILMSCDDLGDKGWDRSTGYGRINFKKALQADPDHFLQSRLVGAKVLRREGKRYLQFYGQAEGTRFRRRLFQIAVGEKPRESDWKTIVWDQTTVADVNGLLATVPLAEFDTPGRWSIRCAVQDRLGRQRESQGTISIGR